MRLLGAIKLAGDMIAGVTTPAVVPPTTAPAQSVTPDKSYANPIVRAGPNQEYQSSARQFLDNPIKESPNMGPRIAPGTNGWRHSSQLGKIRPNYDGLFARGGYIEPTPPPINTPVMPEWEQLARQSLLAKG